jgi:hypothetical protein
MLPVLFSGSLSAAMISSGDNAAAGCASSSAVEANISTAAREGKDFIYVILILLSMKKWYTDSPLRLRNLRRHP